MPQFLFCVRNSSQQSELKSNREAFEKASQMAQETRALVAIFRRRPSGELIGIGAASPKQV